MTSVQKQALVTGGSRRIGKAIAKALHQAGYRVIIHYNHSCDEATALCDELNQNRNDSAVMVQGDLCNPGQLQQLIDNLQPVIQQQGGLNLLVNNASSFYPTPVGEITEEDWQVLVGSNMKAPLFLSQALAPSLRENNGAIINLIDIHARKPMPTHTVYCMAKAGLEMMTKSLARELAPDVRVNGVSPGAILWPEQGSGLEQEILAKIPMGRSGDPTDIAKTVLFLAEAGYITGQIIAVDGGRSLNL